MFTFEISGQQAISRAFKKLPKKHAKKAVRKGARASAKIFAKAIKQQAPRATGNLRKNVKVRAGKRSTKRIVVNATATEKENFYGSFVQFGSGQAANPFVTRAYDQSKNQAEKVASKVISTETKKLLKEAKLK